MSDKKVVAFPIVGRQPAARRFFPARLRDARQAFRLSQPDLAARINVTRQAISAFERGEKMPDAETFDSLVRALEQPVSFFATEEGPGFGQYGPRFFRKIGADTERRNQACLVLGKWLVETTKYFDEFINYPIVNIPAAQAKSLTGRYEEEEIEEIAAEVRRHWNLGLGPISNVLALIENNGVVSCRYDIPGERVDAFSFWNGDRPFVFMAMETESGCRVRFDLAHELGHLILHRYVESEELASPKTLREIEREADRFASAFLLPQETFGHEVYTTRLDAFIDLKLRWKASVQAMVYRCKQLGIVDDDQYTNLYKSISFRKWRTREPLDDPKRIFIEQPKILQKAIGLLLESGRKRADEILADLRLAPSLIEIFCNLVPGSLARASALPELAEPMLDLKPPHNFP